MALISLQQRKHFIAIRALLDLVSGGFADSNEAYTYHYGRNTHITSTIHTFCGSCLGFCLVIVAQDRFLWMVWRRRI